MNPAKRLSGETDAQLLNLDERKERSAQLLDPEERKGRKKRRKSAFGCLNREDIS